MCGNGWNDILIWHVCRIQLIVEARYRQMYEKYFSFWRKTVHHPCKSDCLHLGGSYRQWSSWMGVLRHHKSGGVAHRHDLSYTADGSTQDDPRLCDMHLCNMHLQITWSSVGILALATFIRLLSTVFLRRCWHWLNFSPVCVSHQERCYDTE